MIHGRRFLAYFGKEFQAKKCTLIRHSANTRKEPGKRLNMQSSRTIMNTIRSNLKAGAGDDCFVSQMVIRTERDKPYLSIFASQRQPESGKNTFGRPTIYCLCDIETGAILSVYQCAKRDFTNASYKERYQG